MKELGYGLSCAAMASLNDKLCFMMVFHHVIVRATVDNAGKPMEIVVSEHLLQTLPERMRRHEGCLIIADPRTYNAVGETIVRALSETLKARLWLLPEAPKATMAHACEIEKALVGASSAIAIGSGTINDIVKYASHKSRVAYSIIATAPSMNGYSSSTASLIDNGYKRSFEATSPVGIYADLDVLAQAPHRMIAAGIGDVLCRSTVETDWRLAHALGKATFEEPIMAPVREAEKAVLPVTSHIKGGDKEAMKLLWSALIAGGNAMRAHHSSMPASQGEHMIAHAMEAEYGANGSLHGEDIAVCTLAMTALQEKLLNHPRLSAHAAWIGEHMHSHAILHEALAEGGCPLTPKANGWDDTAFKHTANEAWKTRDRYGFLHFAAELGILMD